MPTTLSELPDQPLLIACAAVIALTALAGWIYASRGPKPALGAPVARSRRARTTRTRRRLVDPHEAPTVSTPVYQDIAAPKIGRAHV
jgi:hypothetical protein